MTKKKCGCGDLEVVLVPPKKGEKPRGSYASEMKKYGPKKSGGRGKKRKVRKGNVLRKKRESKRKK